MRYIPIMMTLIPSLLLGEIYFEPPKDFKPDVEVVGCFLEYEGKILLLHRQDSAKQGNLWGIPGGKLEKTETAKQAAVREVFEETGLDISKNPLKYVDTVYIREPTHDFIFHMMKTGIKKEAGNVKLSFREHKGFTWVTPNDALKMDLMLDEEICIKTSYPEI